MRDLSLIAREKEGWVQPNPPSCRTGKSVEIIGSGLAGANRLNYLVTVYERADRPEGLPMYGIPSDRLDKHIILRRINPINQMEAEGVMFECGIEVGRDQSAKSLLENTN